MPIRAILAAILVALCWGGNYTATKFALMDFTPLVALGLRFSLLSLMLLPWILRQKSPRLNDMAILSVLLVVLQFGMLFIALSMGLSISATIVASQLGVPFACILAAIIFKDYLGPWRSGGLALAFLGVMVVAGTPNAAAHWQALLLIVLASFGWALANLYLKWMPKTTPTATLFWPGVLAMPQLALLSLLFEHGQAAQFTNAHAIAWAGVVYSAVFSSLVGYGLWNWLITKYPMSQVMPYALLMPIFGISIGAFTFGEPVTTQLLLGGALTIVGVGIISLRRPKLLQMEQ